MRFHRWKLNEKKAEGERGARQYWYYVRRFLTIHNKEDREVYSGSLEIVVHKKLEPWTIFGILFRVGGAGNTPWKGHLILLGFGIYWRSTIFRKLAHRISCSSERPYDTRTLSLRLTDGCLNYSLWAHDDLYSNVRRKPKKRYKRTGMHRRRTQLEGSILLNPVELIWGPLRYTYEDLDAFWTLIEMPEDSYSVFLQLQKEYRGRPKAKQQKFEGYIVDVDSPRGVPAHHDKSGGWKGDRVYGFSVGIDISDAVALDISGENEWREEAVKAVTKWVEESRIRTGFTVRQED